MSTRESDEERKAWDDKLVRLAMTVREEGLASAAFAEMYELVMSRYVPQRLRRFSHWAGNSTRDDMRSAAAEAVMRAVNDWDPDSGKPFPAYLTRAISNATSKANAEARVWETGRDSTRHLNRLRVIHSDLVGHGEPNPSPQRIAEEFCEEKATRFRKQNPAATDAEVEAYLRKNGYAKVRDDLSWAERLHGAERFDAPAGDDSFTLYDRVGVEDKAVGNDLGSLFAIAEEAVGGADALRIAELHGSMSAARECGDTDTANETSEILAGAGRAPASAVKRLRTVMGSPQALFVCLDAELEDRIDDVGDVTAPAAAQPLSVAELCRVGA